jgi:SagB-type dehydrogenase family enzyme
MSTIAPREYDDLTPRPSAPLSRLHHENSKLTERRALALGEQMELFASGPDGEADEPAFKVYPSRPSVALPRPSRRLFGARLDDTLRARRSPVGAFPGGPVRFEELGALLGLSLGVTGDGKARGARRRRAYPSAGALHPLETYVIALNCVSIDPGIHHYDALDHRLARIADAPARRDLARMILAEEASLHAALALVFTATFERTQAKYGERGYRFVLLEAGHAAQNVLLVATSLGLGALPVGGFFEDALGDAIGLDAEKESPVYVVLVGGRQRR